MSSLSTKTGSIAWAVWVIASVFYAYQYILRVMPNIMLADIMAQFNISAATFGQFSGVYYIGYSLLHLPVGIMLDRYGPRKMMSICILLTVVGLMPLLFASHWIYPIFGRFLIGLGSSAAILGVFKIIRMTFTKEQFPRMLSLSVTIGLIGAIYGGAPVSYMRETFGYHAVVQLFAISGVLLALITYWIVPVSQTASQGTVLSDVKQVLSNKKVIYCCIFAGMMIGPLEGFADVWGTLFLTQVYGYNSTLAASVPSMIYIGMCFGAPVLSYIADKIGSYLIAIIGAGIIMAAGFASLLIWHVTSEALSISFVFVGISCAYQILAIYKATTYVGEEVAGITTAVANMIIMTFGYTFHALIGGVIDIMGGTTVSQAIVYGIAVIPVGLVLGTAGFIFLFVKEKVATQEAIS